MVMKKVNSSVVLSVSIGKGCYRHIQLSLNETLEELADTIIRAFDFCNDHAHAFFMDNKAWSNCNCYFMAEVDEDDEYPHTCNVKLSKLGLQKDDKFKFIFDFGDEWEFQCKVLRIIDEDTDDAMIIRMVGTPPEQYPEYE